MRAVSNSAIAAVLSPRTKCAGPFGRSQVRLAGVPVHADHGVTIRQGGPGARISRVCCHGLLEHLHGEGHVSRAPAAEVVLALEVILVGPGVRRGAALLLASGSEFDFKGFGHAGCDLGFDFKNVLEVAIVAV